MNSTAKRLLKNFWFIIALFLLVCAILFVFAPALSLLVFIYGGSVLICGKAFSNLWSILDLNWLRSLFKDPENLEKQVNSFKITTISLFILAFLLLVVGLIIILDYQNTIVLFGVTESGFGSSTFSLGTAFLSIGFGTLYFYLNLIAYLVREEKTRDLLLQEEHG